MSLTPEELGLITSNYKNYKSRHEATKSMPKVLAYVRELETQVVELKAALKKASVKPAPVKKAPVKPAPAKKAPAKKAPARKK